jgi:hypothetical protein
MFIYNFNEKGLKKFEKDINERIKEADSVCITLKTEDTQLSVDLTKEEIHNLEADVRVRFSGYTYIDFNLKKIFLGNVTIEHEVLEILYYYDNYDSIEHLHEIRLNNSSIIFEYYNILDETIVKSYEDNKE